MISLCVDARLMNAAGIGSFLRNILAGLDQSKFQITLLVNSQDLLEASLCFPQMQICELKSKIYSIKEQLELFLKIPKVDLFWSPHFNIPLLPIMARRRVVTIHDCFHLEYSNQFSLYKRAYAHLIYNGAAFHADCLVTDSLFSQMQMEKHFFYKKKPLVIFPGIDLTHFFKRKENELTVISKKYELPTRFLLTVGNVKPHKNLVRLLAAFSKVKKNKEFNDLKLMIVGKKEGFISEDQTLKQDYEKHPFKSDIQFTGYVLNEDLPAIYSLAQALVFPSLYEGFGLPPLEAMACQCPVIASDSASIPEICQESAYYINPLDIEMMANAIIDLLTNEKASSELIKKGLEHVRNFSNKLPSKQYSLIFEKLTQKAMDESCSST